MRSLLWPFILVPQFAFSQEQSAKPTFTSPAPPASLSFSDDKTFPVPRFNSDSCKKYDCFLTFIGNDGKEIVRINQHTGQVIVAHPEKMDESARQFWLAVTRTFGELHCAAPTKK